MQSRSPLVVIGHSPPLRPRTTRAFGSCSAPYPSLNITGHRANTMVSFDQLFRSFCFAASKLFPTAAFNSRTPSETQSLARRCMVGIERFRSGVFERKAAQRYERAKVGIWDGRVQITADLLSLSDGRTGSYRPNCILIHINPRMELKEL